MQPEEKKKIQAWFPVSIYNQIESFGFKNQNEAVIFSFVKLIEDHTNNQIDSNFHFLTALIVFVVVFFIHLL